MVDRVGKRLDNYRLDRMLGEGAFGEVYLGEHIYRKQQVAIKVLQPLAYDDLTGFLNEARTFRLRHPNIVQVIDFGVEGKLPFLVMEYAPHGTLRQRHPRGTKLPLNTIVSYLKQIAGALYYAHDERLVHRDIKPENMLLGPNKEVLVSDFGLATVTRSSRSVDAKGIAGTLAYMAPEQIQGKPCAASDQYALGIVVYEWLSGSLPFKGSLVEMATQHILSAPPSLLTRVPELSPEIEQVVLKALEKDASRRFINIREFASAFEKAVLQFVGATVLIAKNLDRDFEHNYCSSITWSPDGDYLALCASTSKWNPHSKEFSVHVWNVTIPETNTIYTGHSSSITALKWSSDGKRIASSSYDGTIQIWNADTGKIVACISEHSAVKCMSWSPNDIYILSVSEREVNIWDVLSGEKVVSLPVYRLASMIEWSPNNLYFAYVEACDTVKICKASTHTIICEYDHYDNINGVEDWDSRYDSDDLNSVVNAIAWSPDGRYLASCSSGGEEYTNTVKVIDTTVETVIFTYFGHHEPVDDTVWSPDGKRIASVSGNAIHMWDATTGSNLLICNKYLKWDSCEPFIESIAWSPHSRYLASGNHYGEVDIWDTITGDNIFTYKGHVQSPESTISIKFITWSSDGRHIASADEKGTLCVWIAPH